MCGKLQIICVVNLVIIHILTHLRQVSEMKTILVRPAPMQTSEVPPETVEGVMKLDNRTATAVANTEHLAEVVRGVVQVIRWGADKIMKQILLINMMPRQSASGQQSCWLPQILSLRK